jgi:hypothetical protein
MDEQKHLKTCGSPGAYVLLQSYQKETEILAKAMKMSESYYLNLHKILTYPLIILSSFTTVMVGIDSKDSPVNLSYYILALSLMTTLFAGFNTAINPKEKESRYNQVSTEFSEISANIRQYITENGKTKDELKVFSNQQLVLVELWRSLSPPINQKYLKQAGLELAERPPRSLIQKKRVLNLDVI